ncbi:MAG: DUF362 domain-containing protein [Chloroflexi bacterium]|nr:DUF362 domain-containing protein [Chloroflexota bacterium]
MEKIYLLNLEKYDPAQIAAGLKTASAALGVSLEQKSAILLADCPWAHSKLAPHAHTNTGFVEGVAEALKPANVTLAANSLPDFPARYGLKLAGYPGLSSKIKARLLHLDEAAMRSVTLKAGKAAKEAKLPSAWLDAPFKVMLPKLRQSTLVPFAGAIRQLLTLLPKSEQLSDSHLLPEKMVDLLSAVPVDLIAVDAIQALDRGGEVSGQPVELGVVIVGTNPLAVDMVCAVALGLDPAGVDFLQEAHSRGMEPASLEQIEILGDLTLADLRARAAKVELVDPNPVNFPLPEQVKVIRSEKARQAGVSGVLADVFYMLKNAGISLKSAPLTSIVIGAVDEIPAGKDEYSTIIFMDDTSRGAYTGYGRIIRLPGRNSPISQVLNIVPYVMKVFNPQAELGSDLMVAKFISNIGRIFPQK